MKIEIPKKKDYKKANEFVIVGTHAEAYSSNKFMQNLYGKYFLYIEMQKATQILAAYESESL